MNPFIRLLASIRFGVTILILTLIYASILSALAPVRGALELTEMAAFRHWVFVVLTVLLCMAITTVTLTRIRWNVINAGVLTTHAGILTLCAGSWWYFGGKLEGDVVLRTPRLQLVSTGGQGRVVADVLPEAGQTWHADMPAFGGHIELEVVAAEKPGAAQGVQQVLVRTRVGAGEPQMTPVLANGRQTALSDGLALQLVTFPAERTFYDNETAALYFRTDGGPWRYVALHGLPYFRERYLDEGYTLFDTESREVPSKRTTPTIVGTSIPTGWFEAWRMPIEVPLGEAPFDLSITGYVPYVAGTKSVATPGGAVLNPAATFRLGPAGGPPLEKSLFALDPQASLLNLATPIEFRYVTSAEEREALLRPLVGPDELEIEVTDPPQRMVIPVQSGQSIAVEGTDYELTVGQMFPSWPLMSPGFENALSPAVLVDVKRGDLTYQRTVIQRFPQLQQDIDAQGVRKRDGLLDENLRLRYRTARNGYVLILADAGSLAQRAATLAAFDATGQVQPRPMKLNETQHVPVAGLHMDLTLTELIENAQKMTVPVIEPLETRRPNLAARTASGIRLKVAGKEALEGWGETRWMFFTHYPFEGTPLSIQTPDGKSWDFLYTRQPHDLGAQLVPGKLSVKFFPGRRSVDSWRSDFVAQVDGDEPVVASVSTNNTFTVGRWTLFQSGAATDHWSYTILGVGNRYGIWPMLAGCVLITLGSMYAFYVKPILRRRQIQRALTATAPRSMDANGEPHFNGGRRAGDLVEVAER